mmetsp:Transcript_36305/g.117372  ORF Transcript_36305/g.117372 Transcript_36305/m.117372 type:complete len:264 (-) Transcript_36305:2247-3038(-)
MKSKSFKLGSDFATACRNQASRCRSRSGPLSDGCWCTTSHLRRPLWGSKKSATEILPSPSASHSAQSPASRAALSRRGSTGIVAGSTFSKSARAKKGGDGGTTECPGLAANCSCESWPRLLILEPTRLESWPRLVVLESIFGTPPKGGHERFSSASKPPFVDLRASSSRTNSSDVSNNMPSCALAKLDVKLNQEKGSKLGFGKRCKPANSLRQSGHLLFTCWLQLSHTKCWQASFRGPRPARSSLQRATGLRVASGWRQTGQS